MDLVLEDADRMNLLGLFLKAALEARGDALERAAPRGNIAITAGRMSVTLACMGDRIVIRRGIEEAPRAHIKGSLESLVAIARGKLVREVLSGRVRIRGNLVAALPFARVFRTPATHRVVSDPQTSWR